MNQQTGDPDEASPDYVFNSVRERETVVTLFDAKMVRRQRPGKIPGHRHCGV